MYIALDCAGLGRQNHKYASIHENHTHGGPKTLGHLVFCPASLAAMLPTVGGWFLEGKAFHLAFLPLQRTEQASSLIYLYLAYQTDPRDTVLPLSSRSFRLAKKTL